MPEAHGPRVRRNEWQVLVPPAPGSWRPTRTVSVIIPAYQRQDLLDLALAALSRQTYPAELLEVVVVDDGSEPELKVPPLCPAHTRIVRAPDLSSGWGRANALHTGALASDGEILHWLDADLLPCPEHVEAQARWQHASGDAVTLGFKRFVPHGPWPTPREVADGRFEALFPVEQTEPHGYVEELIDTTRGLRDADHLVFRAHVGATSALTRELYQAAGALRTDLRLGEDSEFGYRLAQAGAVFIPEPGARSWHLGPSHMMRDGHRLRRYNRPYLADLMPQPRWLRGALGRSWRVPLVTAVVTVDGPLEQVRECVDRLLASDEHDLVVLLVGDWHGLVAGRCPARDQPLLDDPVLDHRLLAATYRSEPRVRLVDSAPASVFPSPYLLAVPSYFGVGPATVGRMVAELDTNRLGLLRLVPPGGGAGSAAVPVPELSRTAAVSRARRHRRAGESVADVVSEVWGERWEEAARFGVVDLSLPTDGRSPGAAQHAPVPVAGLRSWLRATAYVGRLAATRARRRVPLPGKE